MKLPEAMSEESLAGLAEFLNEYFNGVDCPIEQRNTTYWLVAYRHDQPETVKCLSNTIPTNVRIVEQLIRAVRDIAGGLQ